MILPEAHTFMTFLLKGIRGTILSTGYSLTAPDSVPFVK